MGFMSKQWLNRGQGVRNRRYSPVNVTVDARNPASNWSRANEVAVEFTASLSNHEFQKLYLTAAEAENAADVILNACSDNITIRLAGKMLAKLSDVELHKVLFDVLKRRVDKAR